MPALRGRSKRRKGRASKVFVGLSLRSLGIAVFVFASALLAGKADAGQSERGHDGVRPQSHQTLAEGGADGGRTRGAWSSQRLAAKGTAAPEPELPVDPGEVKQFVGKVRSVSDGDTIVVVDADQRRNKVRLFGIDAPERGSKDTYGQPYGQRSRQYLSKLVYRATVRVEWWTYDGYGRMIGRVWVGDVDVGLRQVCAGYAWVYRRFIDDFPAKDRRAYLDCETSARAEHRGLWRDSKPVPPWEWRHSPRLKELEP